MKSLTITTSANPNEEKASWKQSTTVLPSPPQEVVADLFNEKPPTTNYHHVVDEVFPQAVKTKPRSKGVIIGFSAVVRAMMMMMNKVPTKMKKMIAIRLMMSSPRVKIWNWRLNNSHYQIPSKGFVIGLISSMWNS